MRNTFKALVELSDAKNLRAMKEYVTENGQSLRKDKDFDQFDILKRALKEDKEENREKWTLLSTVTSLSLPLFDYFKRKDKALEPLLEAFKAIIPALTSSKDSNITYFATIKKHAKQIFGPESPQFEYIRKFLITPQTKIRNKRYNKNVARNLSRVKILSSKTYYDAFVQAYKNDKFTYKVIAAAMASGARFIEIMKIGDFKLDPEGENYIVQRGVAKSRQGEAKIIEKPILFIKPKSFLRLIREIRAKVSEDFEDSATNEEITARYNGAVNSRLKDLFPEDKSISLHQLRAIYGFIAFDEYGQDDETLQGFLARVLGHDEQNIQTAAAYSKIKVQDEDQKGGGKEVTEAEKLQEIITALTMQLNEQKIKDFKQKPQFGSRVMQQRKKIDGICRQLIELGEKPTYSNIREIAHLGSSVIADYFAFLKENNIAPGEMGD